MGENLVDAITVWILRAQIAPPSFDRLPALDVGPGIILGRPLCPRRFSEVEVITGVAFRQRFPMDQKLAVLARRSRQNLFREP